LSPSLRTAEHGTPSAQEDPAAAVLAALAEPNRLRLLRLLLDGERCVTQCTQATGLVQSLVSKHLRRLVLAGLVERRRSGRRSYHSVVDAQRVRQLLSTAEKLGQQRSSLAP
jgi:DNA-binding transcriptional ArsR family regulator